MRVLKKTHYGQTAPSKKDALGRTITIGHARDIVDAYKAGEELDLDSSSCENDEELLYRAEEKWAEADDTYEEVKKLLEELASQKKVKAYEIETG